MQNYPFRQLKKFIISVFFVLNIIFARTRFKNYMYILGLYSHLPGNTKYHICVIGKKEKTFAYGELVLAMTAKAILVCRIGLSLALSIYYTQCLEFDF